MNNNVQAIAVDIDGTLCSNFGSLNKKTIHVFEQLLAKKIALIFVTGRATRRALIITNQIKGEYDNLYLCSYNGGHVMQLNRAKTVLFKKTFSVRETQWFHELADHFNLVIWNYDAFNDKYAYTSKRRSWFTTILKYLNKMELKYFPETENKELTSYKIEIFGNHNNTEGFLRSLLRHCNYTHYAYRFFSFNECFKEFVPDNISKTNSLKLIAKQLKLESKNFICFGNGNNDIEMIEWAGEGVAVRNSNKNVRDAADTVCHSFFFSGVARYLIKRLALNK